MVMTLETFGKRASRHGWTSEIYAESAHPRKGAVSPAQASAADPGALRQAARRAAAAGNASRPPIAMSGPAFSLKAVTYVVDRGPNGADRFHVEPEGVLDTPRDFR